MATLETLHFDNTGLKSLPLDTVAANYVRRNVSGAVFSRVNPTPVLNPRLVCWSPAAMSLLDLSPDVTAPEFVEYFAGNKILPGSEPAAHCYCGHQFGHFSGQLGDGRALSLGEVVNRRGERWELQLKGAGPTPYSRGSDGRAVLRSSIREFLASEAMFYLGVPTTRAGTLITSDTKVVRDLFYDGHPIEEKGTIVLRLSPTFLRFGSFEIFKPQDRITGRVGPSVGRKDLLRQMLDYTIAHHFPELLGSAPTSAAEDQYVELFKEVTLRTARLVATWQTIGFCHGVLNTDNMSILGVTIDYGPYGFLDAYNPGFICNASDNEGRYAYNKQPEIGFWNLTRLADAFGGAVPLPRLRAALDELYWPEFDKTYLALMRRKLGLTATASSETDRTLIEQLFATMAATGADFTCTFRLLSQLAIGRPGGTATQPAEELFERLAPVLQPAEHMLSQAQQAGPTLRQLEMLLSLSEENPSVLAMLGTTRQALLSEVDRQRSLQQLRQKTPAQKATDDRASWLEFLGRYQQRLSLEVPADASDEELSRLNEERCRIMNSANPKFILRNHVMQSAINKAEAGDFSEVQRLFQTLQEPFGESAPDELCLPPTADVAAATCRVT